MCSEINWPLDKYVEIRKSRTIILFLSIFDINERWVLQFATCLDPNWHEQWKQEKCSFLATPKDICSKTQWALPDWCQFLLPKMFEIFL